MSNRLRRRLITSGLGTLIVLGCVAAALLWQRPSEAFPGMPKAERAFWQWVSTINRGDEALLETGIDLLYQHPDLRKLYLRLPSVCAAQEREDECRAALDALELGNAEITLYRDAALAELAPTEGAADTLWMQIAGARALDPALARRVVDRARAGGWLPDIEAVWADRAVKDTMATGAAFGLGYAAVLRQEWDRGEPFLQRVTRLLPDDPEAYRELGRLYYFTGQPDALEEVLTKGLDVASRGYDVENALILRGNLGLMLMQRTGNLERAEAIFRDALEQSRLLADGETEGFNMQRLARLKRAQHHYDEALQLLEGADTLYAKHVPQRHPEVIVLRGDILRSVYRFSDAEATYSRAIKAAQAQDNRIARLQAGLALTQMHARMGRYDQAREIGLEMLVEAQQHRLVDVEILLRIALAEVESRWGNIEPAQTHLQAALELATQSKSQKRIADLHRALGYNALRVRDNTAAQAHFNAMLEQMRALKDTVATAMSLSGLGETYRQSENYDKAVELYDQAQALYQQKQSGAPLFMTLLRRGMAEKGRGRYDVADSVLAEARQMLPQLDGAASYRFHLEVISSHLRLEQGLYQKAVQHVDAAERTGWGARSTAVFWHALRVRAEAHWRLGHRAEAERDFLASIDLVEAMRDNLNSREGRALFLQDKISVYKKYAAFLEEQGRTEEAFEYVERARSRSLSDLLFSVSESRLYEAGSAEDQLIESLRRRRALADALVEEGEAEENASSRPTRMTRASQLRREYQRADSVYEQSLVQLGEQRMLRPLLLAKTLSYKDTRALLQPDEAMIVYNLWPSDAPLSEGRTSSVYVISSDTAITRAIDIATEDLEETILFFREQLDASEAESDMWQPASRRLHEILLEPALASLPPTVQHLHLVPEGMMHYLPFAALKDSTDRFLIERFSLSVTPSASVLALARERNPRIWRSILTVADPNGRLPGSRREAEAIASIPSIRPVQLTGKNATQEQFELMAEAADIIHIATHGSFVSQAPWASSLELYDDVLSVEEIGRLELNAYLVTLSACETALSGGLNADVPAGDEWVGLSQAFLAAGTPTVMASLWPIDDQVSSDFMISFYEKLLGRRGKAEALADVQRRFLRNPETGHPFYWAAFAVIGDPR